MHTFSALQSMDIVIRMEMALAGEGNMVIFSLKKAIADKQPANLIIRTTQEMIKDNYIAIANILGIKLTDKIRDHVI